LATGFDRMGPMVEHEPALADEEAPLLIRRELEDGRAVRLAGPDVRCYKPAAGADGDAVLRGKGGHRVL
jgi:hypothetical protein